MTLSTESDVNKFLKSIELPEIGLTVGDVGRVLDVTATDAATVVKIELGFPAAAAHDAYRQHIAAAISAETASRRGPC